MFPSRVNVASARACFQTGQAETKSLRALLLSGLWETMGHSEKAAWKLPCRHRTRFRGWLEG